MRVKLWKCDKCHLMWVDEQMPTVCPSCRRRKAGSVTISLASARVTIEHVRVYGANPIADAISSRSLEGIDLGCRCPHGYISEKLCKTCNGH